VQQPFPDANESPPLVTQERYPTGEQPLFGADEYHPIDASDPIVGEPLGPRPAAPPSDNRMLLQVRLLSLRCDNTTEWGHDEVYCIIGGMNGDGGSIKSRPPNASQGADADDGTAWDMNDSGEKQNRWLDVVLYEEPLTDGQTATLNFAFLESDSWSYDDGLRAAAKLSEWAIPNPFGSILGDIFDRIAGLIPENSDDPLGSFSLQVANRNGELDVQTIPGQYTSVEQPWQADDGTFGYFFNHEDGRYHALFAVQLVAAQ
jgi:hypothetical protein